MREPEYYGREHQLDLPYGAAAEALGLAGVWMSTDIHTGAVEEQPPDDDPN